MTQEHPITPPPELFTEWLSEALLQSDVKPTSGDVGAIVAVKAAQWGADMELEACCELVPGLTNYLRAARRPKPPSLKEQALEALQFVDEKLDLPLHNHCFAIHTIRRALEALDD